MAVNVTALLMIVCYYWAVVFVGVWAGRKGHSHRGSLTTSRLSVGDTARKQEDANFLMRLFVANRHLPLVLGVGSMTATWVGGGYLNGTAEAVYTRGILHSHAPVGYAISLVLGGAFFADKMRVAKCVTMLDPLQSAYGRIMGVLLCVPAVCGEVFWTAAVLAALGDTASAIMEVDSRFFIVASAMVIFFYTSLGGLYSVTYTDFLQISSTAVCLWICVPYCLSHHAVGVIGPPENNWVGSVPVADVGQFLDLFLMTSFGGIPWQVYFQRVLGCETDFAARMLSYMAAIGCIFLAIPPILIGAAAKSTNFTAAGYRGPYRLRDKDRGSVLPYSIRYLTSGVVSIVGLIGITAAVMSSADSSMLSASSLVTRNVYQVLFRPSASDNEVALMLRVMVCVIGSCATYIALHVQSVFELWSLCSDVVYVLLFPQLLCALYFKNTNTYGSLLAFFLGAFFRGLCGEPRVNLKAVLRLPLYDDQMGQRFPFRLTCMGLALITLLVGSYLAAKIFEKGWLTPHYDIFGCFRAEAKRDKNRPPLLHSRRDSARTKDEVSVPGTRDTGSAKAKDEWSVPRSRDTGSAKAKDEVSVPRTRDTGSTKAKYEVSVPVTRDSGSVAPLIMADWKAEGKPESKIGAKSQVESVALSDMHVKATVPQDGAVEPEQGRPAEKPHRRRSISRRRSSAGSRR